MAKRYGWSGSGIFKNEPPKSPWGNGGGNSDGDGSSGSGPRNPWSQPPGGKRPRGAAGTLDDLLRRARNGGGGGGGGGAGIPGFPASGRLWLLILAGLVAVWVVFTSFHAIGPQERGVVTTFGRYSGTLEPGISFTLPAPLSAVTVVDVQNIRTESFPDTNTENLMLTGDQNIVDLAYSVRWDIANAPAFVFQIARPKETVRAAAETAMRAVVATASLNDTIGSGRTRIEAQVQVLMQQILDDYQSGIRIQGVAIKNASAPQAVDEEFKQVTAAQQNAEAARNNANAYAQQILAAAQGEAAEFDKIYEQYRLAPEVTRRRIYYETMEQILARTNKTIVEAPGVTPYLALPELRKTAPPNPDVTVQGQKPPQGASR